jgi:hypothetical protein
MIKNQIEFITCWTRRINLPKQQPRQIKLYMTIIYIFDLDFIINYGFELWVEKPLIIKVLINN